MSQASDPTQVTRDRSDQTDSGAPSAKQPRIDSLLQTKYSAKHPKTVKMNKLVVKFIAKDMQPLSVVSNPGFIDLVQGLDPNYTLPSRAKVTRDLLPEIYAVEKLKLQEALKKSRTCFPYHRYMDLPGD